MSSVRATATRSGSIRAGEEGHWLSEIFATRPRTEWARLLEGAGIPNGPIHTLDQVVSDAQTRALGMIQKRAGSDLELVGLPLSFDGARPRFTKPAPMLGEDNETVLG